MDSRIQFFPATLLPDDGLFNDKPFAAEKKPIAATAARKITGRTVNCSTACFDLQLSFHA
jgi:hypothetical protein